MDKLTNKQMIERLTKFRDAGDKLSDDIYNISLHIFDIIKDADARQNKDEAENETIKKLKNMIELLMQSSLDSYHYNQSMWDDYTTVIKSLGENSGGNKNA